jgi:hypothetical protein
MWGSQKVALQELQRQRWIRRFPKYPVYRFGADIWRMSWGFLLALCGEKPENDA